MQKILSKFGKIAPPTPRNIEAAARTLAEGGLVAIPTETVYGLAGNALDKYAVARIFEAKGRPFFNPLIIHVADLHTAKKLAEFSAEAEKLAAAYWPGPLTLVLKRKAGCPITLLATAGLDSIGLRVPAHRTALAVIREARLPLAAPSANSSGAISPTTARHVANDLGGKIDMILDGGACEIGVESTVLDVRARQPRILRPGAVTKEELERFLGARVGRAKGAKVESPGQLESHYAPKAKMRLNAKAKRKGEILIGFGKINGDFNLSETGNVVEAAANLYALLHAADAEHPGTIAVAPVPDKGLGAAINDRLRRAAG